MAGGRARGCSAQVPADKAPNRDATIEELRRQIAELNQRLDVQESRRDRRRDLGIRVKFPEFVDTLQAEDFVDWINEVERMFEGVPDRIKVKLVANTFTGRASAWWEQLRRSRDRQGKSKITDWEKMKKKMQRHFLPFGYQKKLIQRQGARAKPVVRADDGSHSKTHTPPSSQPTPEENSMIEQLEVEEAVEVSEAIYDEYDDDDAVSPCNFLINVEPHHDIFSLLPCGDVDESEEEQPVKVQCSLTESTTVMPDNLPLELPPMKKIPHHIDFVHDQVARNIQARNKYEARDELTHCTMIFEEGECVSVVFTRGNLFSGSRTNPLQHGENDAAHPSDEIKLTNATLHALRIHERGIT